MPVLSRAMIRTAFLNLWIGFGVATLIMIWKGKPDLIDPVVGTWVFVHVNLLLVGWMVQLSMGVAYWILPRLPNTLTERGRYPFALGAAIFINAGVWGYSVAVISRLEQVQVVMLVCQLLAIVSFAIHIAPRIRPAVIKST